MSALVCLYAIGIGALIAVAAAATEWAVQGRIATRHLWTMAMLGALLVPPWAIVQHARGLAVHTTSPTRAVFGEVVELGHTAGVAMGTHDARSPLHTLRGEYHMMLDRVASLRARTVLELWVLASLALLAWIAFGLVHWDREARGWEEIELDGVSVHLSAETGPAVLGVLSQRIVLPEWVRALAPEYRRLMLAHECEHIAARDPQRLALALVALTLMPWNPALWWCAARLRRAIEMDCDARVLRLHPSPRAYGHLLLQVAARGNNAGPLAVPLVNLLRLPSELELRLLAMARPRTIAGRTLLAGIACAVAAVSVAFTTPVPRTMRPTIRNLVQATRTRVDRVARAARGEHAVGSVVVRVGSSVLQFDSATVSPERGQVEGRLRSLRVATAADFGAVDTIPSAVAEDSIQRLARQLAEQARRLDSVRAHADSLDTEVRLMRSRAAMLKSAESRASVPVVDSGARPPDLRTARTLRRMYSALTRYYPGVLPLTTVRSAGSIWFLADSSGDVIETRKLGPEPGLGFPAPNVDQKDVDFVVIRKTPADRPRFGVVWVQLKR